MPAPGSGPPSGPPADDPGSGDRGGSGGGSILTPTQYLTTLAMTQCDQLFACRMTYPNGDVEFVAAFGAAQTDCYDYAVGLFDPILLEGEVSKQRLSFDGAAAASCIAGFGEPDCTVFWTRDWQWGSACYQVFAGSVPDGGACAASMSCAHGGSVCDPATLRCGPPPM
ncbi:MAG: hypothetical protein JNL83_01875 [Myxococcales bacterium]|nr:hypothetical protein [Myxococcales bacterium]